MLTPKEATMIPIDVIAVKVCSSIFTGTEMPDGFVAKSFKAGSIKAAVGHGLTIIEQNPDTSSSYAKMAKEGHKIAWVLRNNQYLGAVIDGKPDTRLHWEVI